MEPAMQRTALVTLNMRELDRLKVIQAVVDLGLKPGRAAERLGLTVWQIERLVIRYRESGAAGLTSRKRGGPGNRRLDAELAQRALTIIRDRYADFRADAGSETAGKGVTQFGRGAVRAQHRDVLCELEPGEGARRARQRYVAGPARERA
jgi:transposase